MLRKKSISERRAIQSSAGFGGASLIPIRGAGRMREGANLAEFCGAGGCGTRRMCGRLRIWESNGSFRDSMFAKQKRGQLWLRPLGILMDGGSQLRLRRDADAGGCGRRRGTGRRGGRSEARQELLQIGLQ